MEMVYCDLTWYDLETGREVGRVAIPNRKSITPYELRKTLGELVSNCMHSVNPENSVEFTQRWLPNHKFDFSRFGYEVEYSMAAVIEGKTGRQKIYF